jgi:hypothetical protein
MPLTALKSPVMARPRLIYSRVGADVQQRSRNAAPASHHLEIELV